MAELKQLRLTLRVKKRYAIPAAILSLLSDWLFEKAVAAEEVKD